MNYGDGYTQCERTVLNAPELQALKSTYFGIYVLSHAMYIEYFIMYLIYGVVHI